MGTRLRRMIMGLAVGISLVTPAVLGSAPSTFAKPLVTPARCALAGHRAAQHLTIHFGPCPRQRR